jgi:hypothetical protein
MSATPDKAILRYKIAGCGWNCGTSNASQHSMRKIQAPLFILSHMRSYSSLLAHVLGSHPEIDGYCETHLRYYFPFDVLRLHWRVRKLTGEPLRGRYVLDKILHNYAIAPSILDGRRTRAVLLLRRPVEVVQSILHMGTHLDPLARNTDLEHVSGYYVARLERLTELARRLGRRAAFLESEALLERTDDTLEFLRDHLELSGPLQRHYRSFAKTGKPKFGDPSPAIHSGEIGGGYRVKRAQFAVPTGLVDNITAAHAACLDACRRHCVPMSGTGRFDSAALSETAPQPSVA